MTYKLGIDVGSTTLKAVLLDDDDQIIYKSYERHQSYVRQKTYEKLIELKSLIQTNKLSIAITGSAGLGIANDSRIAFVQEVFATALGVKKLYPQTDSVIELGGEDAKIIFLNGALEERMNSTCAGGTGAFIDQMASLLNVDLQTLDELSLKHDMIYPIASRCGVFAKTDVQPLINQGVAKSDLAASIFQAVVDQCITGLAQGRKIEGNVLFLGGPLYFLKGLQQRFQETLKLDDEHAIFPDLSPYFVAYGAALYAKQTSLTYTFEEIMTSLETMLNKEIKTDTLDPLFQSKEEYDAFIKRHQQHTVPYQAIQSYQGNAWLGIDSGSTTTKLVLIGENNQILYESYANNKGNPVTVILEELKNIYKLANKNIHINHSAVTGYGEQLMKAAFHIDDGIVETMAHYHAAKYFNPNVDFIIDIGGQDMKCFHLKDHSIDDILLNEACSSGCGSFLETFAKNMGYSVEEFSKLGLASKHPVNLGTRCTVFMNSSVKEAQKNGAPIEDIAAGLCMSVVKNALYKVIRIKDPNELGKQIVVQGGTFLNDTVLRCFEQTLQHPVIRPSIAHLMGAYGAALFAKSKASTTSSLLSLEELNAFTHETKNTRCGLCTNHCHLTINLFADSSKHIAGNKCERPIIGRQSNKELPNLYDYKYHYLTSLDKGNGTKGIIGIPLVLNMYEFYPFWHAFFTTLGYQVQISGRSTKSMYAKGQQTIASDTICYPAKLVHGHIQQLLDQHVDHIFYPCMTYNIDEHTSKNHYNCPVVAYYPEVIQANMDLGSIPFHYPYIYLDNIHVLEKELYGYFKKEGMKESRKDIHRALEKAYQAYHQYKDEVQKEGQRALLYAKEHNCKVIVLAGRPYHIDPLINHGIHHLLSQLGFVVLSEDSLPKTAMPSIHVLNQWTFHARLYQAAQFVSLLPHAELIHLVSFGCGIDAITSDEVKAILRRNHKLYTQIKIDEVDNLAAIKIRCRSLLAAMEEREM